MHDLHVPEKVRRNALARGEEGRAWLAGLGAQVAEYERRWGLRVSQAALGGTEGFVALAKTEAGEDVVLKIVMAGMDMKRQEQRTLRAANGNGYARLLRADEENNVLLLERLGHQLHQCGYPEEQVLAAICATLEDAWMPQPEGPPFATGADRAEELAGVIGSYWEKLGRPCAEQIFDTALRFAARRKQAFDPEQSVLVHGDAHEWNTLAVPGSRTMFKLVDPDGAFAEKAFDLSVPMREWGAEIPSGDLLQRARNRCSQLADLTGVAPQPIWEWSVMQLVWNGLLLQEIGLDAPARVEFAMADAIVSGGETFAP